MDNRSQNKESSLTKALRQIQQLNSRILELEQQHQDYVHQQQNLIGAIAEICVSPIQEIEALRILIHRGEGECRRYLRSVLVKRSQALYKSGVTPQVGWSGLFQARKNNGNVQV